MTALYSLSLEVFVVVVIDHFSGPGRAMNPICVCARAAIVELNDLTLIFGKLPRSSNFEGQGHRSNVQVLNFSVIE